MRFRFTAVLLLPWLATGSMAAGSDQPTLDQNCMARILADVPAEEAPEQTKSKSNKLFGPITRIKVNRRTGKMTFCGANTYCYNSNAFEFVSPCRIKRDADMSDGTFFSFFTR